MVLSEMDQYQINNAQSIADFEKGTDRGQNINRPMDKYKQR